MPVSLIRGGLRDAIDAMPARALVAIMVFLHVAVTSWQLWYCQINDDGVLYIRAARLIVGGHFSEARAIYNWLGFPLLIAAASKVTTLDALVAGKLINLFASTGTLILLLRICWILLPSKTAVFIVAILIAGNYSWNEMRGALVRDELYYFFVIFSFFALLRDSLRPNVLNRIGFVCACICASLFRMEAAALLVMVPALLVMASPQSRGLRAVAFTTLLIAGAAIVLAIAYQAGDRDLSRLLSVPTQRIAILRDQVLAPFASRRAFLAYNGMVAGLVVWGILASLNPLSTVLAGWGFMRNFGIRQRYFLRLLICYGLVTFSILAAQTYFTLVFEPRYGLAIGLLLTIPAAIAAMSLIESRGFRQRGDVIATTLTLIWLGYGFFGGLKLTDANQFNYAAAQWLRENVPPGARTLDNNNQISFYGNLAAQNKDNDFFIRSNAGIENIATLRNWSDYDVVIIRLREKQTDQIAALTAAIAKPPSREFTNSRGDRILIYEPRKTAS